MIFNLNDQIIKLVKLQRTWGKKLSPEEISVAYWKSCRKDFDQLKPYINPGDCLLDIGCGIAGADLIIGRHFPDVRLVLFDLDRIESKPKYGFSESPGVYNTRQAVAEFFELNNAPQVPYFTAYPMSFEYDVIISLISCGFHYPVGTYLKKILRTLKPEGRLILDIRHGTKQKTKLAKHFKFQKAITSGEAYSRIVFSNKEF